MIEVYLFVIPFCFFVAFFPRFARQGFLKAVLQSLFIALTWPVSILFLAFKRLLRKDNKSSG